MIQEREGRRHRGLKVFVLLCALMVIALPAMAAKGGGKGHGGASGGGSINLVLLDSTDGLAHFGQQVTFTVSSSASEPAVRLNCWQGGTWVYTAWGGFFAGSAWGQTFKLGPTNSWSGGAADCTANLVDNAGSGTTLATTSFHVYA